MAQDTTKSLLELVDERPAVDTTGTFDVLWDTLAELRQKFDARFTVEQDPSTLDLSSYTSLDGNAKGSLRAYSGSEIDWFCHTWIGNPLYSFSNMHFSIWLGPQINVPHFGMAMGTMPDVFFYCDYVPRTDLMVDLDYLDRYYNPINDRYVALRADERFGQFVSKTPYMRQSQSQSSHCYLVKPEPDVLQTLRVLAHDMFDTWLELVDSAEPVPEADRAALAERDLFLRRSIADRDPANAMGDRLFGADMTTKLVRSLWGGDRVLPRPHEKG
jgi:hypothetical protein